MWYRYMLCGVVCAAFAASLSAAEATEPTEPVAAATEATDQGAPAPAPEGMVWIPAGTFTMGSDAPYARPDERPAHQVHVDGFWIDQTEVTNAQFRAFVEATGYLTTAEQEVDWEEMKKQLPPGTPKPDDDVLAPFSLVFAAPDQPVPLSRHDLWWQVVKGASWKHPYGPGSSIEGKDNYPVVHMSWDDAMAYCTWAGKALPTEAEWERAARIDADDTRFMWGDTLEPDGKHMANIWQGEFPHNNTAQDGFIGIAPVRSFPPSKRGLYDMAGNVWEWTADQFNVEAYRLRVEGLKERGDSCCMNPLGPETTMDPRNPYASDSRVQKGGSFLCHITYCESYRPAAKMATTPDSGAIHSGFRCVLRPDKAAE